MTIRQGCVSTIRNNPRTNLLEIFKFFMRKNYRLSTEKKKLELERLLSVRNRDSYLNNELNQNYEV